MSQVAPVATSPRHGRSHHQKRRLRIALPAIVVAVGLLQPAAGIGGPQEDAAAALCAAAKTVEGTAPAPAPEVGGATDTLASGSCLRFVTRHYSTNRTQVHAATVNVPSLLDLNGDGAPDLSARITLSTPADDGKVDPSEIAVPPAVESVSIIVQRLPTATGRMDLKIEAIAPVPTQPGREAAFGFDTGPNVEAPEKLVVTLGRAVDPSAGPVYRLAVAEYAPRTSGAGLSLIGSVYRPSASNPFTRINPIVGAMKFTPFPPAPAFFDVAEDGNSVRISSPIRTTVHPEVSISNGSTTRRIYGVINQLPTSLSFALKTLPDGRRSIEYVASSSIGLIELNTRGVSMGPLGTPSFQAVVRGLPSSFTVALPSSSKPLEINSSGTVQSIAVTANNITLGKYRHLYATVAGIPAAPTTPHRVYPPSGISLIDVRIAGSGSLGMVDVELTEGPRLYIPSSYDGVYMRDSLAAGGDAVHGRISGLKSMFIYYLEIVDIRSVIVDIDTTAGRPFRVRLDRQTSSKWEYIQGHLSSLRPDTRIDAVFDPQTYRLTYRAGDSVRPRLDIDTNVGDRLSLHADIPALPQTFKACVSKTNHCMRDKSSRVTQRNSAHAKAFFSLDFKASHQMTVNLRDCIRRNAGTSSSCGQDGYGKWVRASITLQNIALDAWAEWVDESWDIDNILGHLYVDTDNLPVYTDINTDDTSGTDFNIDLNGLRAQNALTYFDRDWTALLVGSGFHRVGTLNCGPNPELEFRPQIPGIDDPWINVAGYVC